MILLIIGLILTILINLAVIYLIRSYEKNTCEQCSNISPIKKQILKSYALITLILIFIVYVLPFCLIILRLKSFGKYLANLIKSKTGNVILTLYLVLGFINIYLLFRYTKQLDYIECNCENQMQEKLRKGLNYYSMIVLIIYIITSIITFALK